ncbi:MAG: ATP-binding protein, partial [Actinomycetota bacterium]
ISHAAASAVRVDITTGDEGINVTIDDNGQGFTADEAADRSRDGHVGLRSLGGLLADVGGSFDVLSNANTGTRVAATIPFSAETAS